MFKKNKVTIHCLYFLQLNSLNATVQEVSKGLKAAPQLQMLPQNVEELTRVCVIMQFLIHQVQHQEVKVYELIVTLMYHGRYRYFTVETSSIKGAGYAGYLHYCYKTVLLSL